MAVKVPCPACDEMMVARAGPFGKFLGCPNYPVCDYIQKLDDNGMPYGKPSDKATREARIRCHAYFDNLWKRGHTSRAGAYRWLAHKFILEKDECHIGLFDRELCDAVIRAIVRTFPAHMWEGEGTPNPDVKPPQHSAPGAEVQEVRAVEEAPGELEDPPG